MNAKELRQEARANLKGKWPKAIIVSIIYSAIIFVIGLLIQKVNSIFSIVELVIMPPLTYGIAYSYYHLKNGEDIGYVDFLTIGFKNFGRSWQVAWEIIKKMWWCVLIAMIPLVIMIFLLGGAFIAGLSSSGLSTRSYRSGYTYNGSPYSTRYNYDYDYSTSLTSDETELANQIVANALAGASVGAMVGVGISFIAYVVLMVWVAIRGMLYTLTYYIAAIKEDTNAKDAINESETLMKGNRGRYFCLMLSFFGWFFLVGVATGLVSKVDILADIVAQLGTAILLPYTTLALIAFYENLARENNVSLPNNKQVSDATNETVE